VRGVKDSTFLHRFGSNIADLGIKGVANQVARGILKDTLTDHVRLLRLRHPKVDIVVIEPLPNDEKMFFHEVMSTSARLVVAQHGYESVLDGMTRNHAHFSTVMARHGIEISPAILDARPWSVPLETVETGEMPERLQHTVFGGRRAKTSGRTSGRVTRLVKALEKVEADRQLPVSRRPAAAAPAPQPRRRSAGTPASTRSRSRRPRSS